MKYILLILLVSSNVWADSCVKPSNLKDLINIKLQIKKQEPKQQDIQFKKA